MSNSPEMTSPEYVKAHGIKCPQCQSYDIDTSSPDYDGINVFCNVECYNCKSTWIDVYQLQCYDKLATPRNK